MSLFKKSLLFYILIIVSCSKTPTDTELNLIEDDLILYLSYDLESKAPTINLRTTSKTFCEETDIQNSIMVSGSTYSITLNDIYQNTDCEDFSHYALSRVLFDQGSSTQWEFTLSAKSVLLTSGKIDKSNTGISMTLDQTEGLIVENNEIFFIPKNHLFGFYSYDTTLGSADTSLQSTETPKWVDQLGAESDEIEAHRDYGHFSTIDHVTIASRNDQGRGFIVKYTEDQLDNIQSAIDNIRTDQDSLTINVYTYDGREL